MSWINTNKTNNQDSHTIEGLSEGQYNIRLKVTNSIGNVISNEINVSVGTITETQKLFTFSTLGIDPENHQLQSLVRVFDMGNGVYRMYFRTFEWGVGYQNLYFVESSDGINWDLNNLNTVNVSNLTGSDGLRLIPHRTESGTWRGVYPTGGNVKTATSSDGITWSDGTTIINDIKTDGFLSFVYNENSDRWIVYSRIRGIDGSNPSPSDYDYWFSGQELYQEHQYRRGINIHKSLSWNSGYDSNLLFDPANEFNYAPMPDTGEVDSQPVRMDIHEMNAVEYTALDNSKYTLGFPSIMLQNSMRNQLRGIDGTVSFLDRDTPVSNYEMPDGTPYNPWWIGNGESYPVAVKSTDGENFEWVNLDINTPYNTQSPVNLEPFKRVLNDPDVTFPTSSNINDTENLYKRNTVGWVRVRDVLVIGDNVHIYMDVAENFHDEAKEFAHFINDPNFNQNSLPTAERDVYLQIMTREDFESNLDLTEY